MTSKSIKAPTLSGSKPRITDYLIATVLALIAFGALLVTPDMGFTRDEGFYFHAAKDYIGWFNELEEKLEEGDDETSFTQENIDKYWSYNPEHPVLMKGLFALSWRSFSQERDWLSPSTAMRLPTMAFTALLVWMLYLFGVEAFGRIPAFFAVAALMTMPRVFFHAHLACFDMGMVTMWFAVFWGYWKSLDSRPWVWIVGLLWGLALSTKLNAFFIPGVLIMHWALSGWAEFGFSRDEAGRLHLNIPKVPAAFFSMILIGPVVFYLLWPRHWYDTFPRIYWYIERHLGHEHYAVFYKHELLTQPPFPAEFPFVMSLYTIPLITLATFLFGVIALSLRVPLLNIFPFVWRRLKATLGGQASSNALALLSLPYNPKKKALKPRLIERRQWLRSLRPNQQIPVRNYAYDPKGTLLLIFLATFIPYLIISRPDTPIFGGTKHWMTAMPFMALVGGVGFYWAIKSFANLLATKIQFLARPRIQSTIALALIVPVLWPALRATLASHPNGTAYYNELIGGPAGAADAGMHRQFWGYASRSGLEWINKNAPDKALVHFHNTLFYSFEMYQEDGLLRDDIRNGWSLQSSHYVLYHHQRAFHPFLYEIWATYGTTSPIFVATIDDVPILSIYENPALKKEALQPKAEPHSLKPAPRKEQPKAGQESKSRLEKGKTPQQNEDTQEKGNASLKKGSKGRFHKGPRPPHKAQSGDKDSAKPHIQRQKP